MLEDTNAELWKELTEKSYDPSKLPEVEDEYDEGAEVDGFLRSNSFKKAQESGCKKTDTTTDAQPPSSSKTIKPSSATFTYTKREYDWKKVKESKKIFLIFGIEHFDKSCVWIDDKTGKRTKTVVNKRDGAKEDIARLTKTMVRLGFEVRIYHNPSKYVAEDILKIFKKIDLSNIEVFGMAISSHGSANNIIYLKDTHTDLNFFVDPIKSNITLAAKPKLFFVNACRGKGIGKTHLVAQGNTVQKRWPYDADCLIHFSTIEKQVSLRDRKTGSYFVSALCDVFDQLKSTNQRDIHEVLAEVNRNVARLDPTPIEDRGEVLQIPVIQSTLTTFLYLAPPFDWTYV
ncbi:Oidioi.mRNA.OKI2018_I69.XSR.g13726.t1.cds [Oikopleura dioica]|uniref:Oidioi.mRNA.OKI2018_I69.XSR.g13726.t1.cds n=1 Tax=Oikopleura dioica TaxID=34765 RepID=A0ABN7SDV9_OIKDI|nr:Oidioi.mRNA.OKI2018_I69.XSR.g13726.t1.cds [Oikopleura dioica]